MRGGLTHLHGSTNLRRIALFHFVGDQFSINDSTLSSVTAFVVASALYIQTLSYILESWPTIDYYLQDSFFCSECSSAFFDYIYRSYRSGYFKAFASSGKLTEPSLSSVIVVSTSTLPCSSEEPADFSPIFSAIVALIDATQCSFRSPQRKVCNCWKLFVCKDSRRSVPGSRSFLSLFAKVSGLLYPFFCLSSTV